MEEIKKGNFIQSIVRSLEDLTRMRVASGQRIAAEFRRVHLGRIDTAATKEEREKLQKEFDSVLEELRKDYIRLTDGIVHEEFDIVLGKLPKPKKFIPTPLITSYGMLLTIDQYIRRLNDEAITVKQLELALEEEPIYTQYLKKIPGIGPKMAGVLLSEINFHEARYVSKMEAYAGLDVVLVGYYDAADGTRTYVSHMDVLDYFEKNPNSRKMVLPNGQEVTLTSVGRTKRAICLEKRPYRKANGEEGSKIGITFNPYLQSKLIAVLAPAFLKVNKTLLDGEPSTTDERMKLANSLGFDEKKVPAVKQKTACIEFLREHGHTVEVVPGEFGKFYYDYRARLKGSQSQEQNPITDLLIHRRAIRYTLKMFFREFYVVGRLLNGLPVYIPYESAKLGYQVHISDRLREDFGVTLETFQYHHPEPKKYPAAIQEYLDRRNKPIQELVAG